MWKDHACHQGRVLYRVRVAAGSPMRTHKVMEAVAGWDGGEDQSRWSSGSI